MSRLGKEPRSRYAHVPYPHIAQIHTCHASQTWLLGFEFPSTFLMFQKNRLCILCSASKGVSWPQYLFRAALKCTVSQSAKILSQLQNADSPVPMEFFVQAKVKDPPTDALPRFLQAYTSQDRVATLTKEQHGGKTVEEWNKAVTEAGTKPALSDMSPAIASLLAVKDEEELVCCILLHAIVCQHLAENCADSSQYHLNPSRPLRSAKTRDHIGSGGQDFSRSVRRPDRRSTGVQRQGARYEGLEQGAWAQRRGLV